jgi:hypothetical protein
MDEQLHDLGLTPRWFDRFHPDEEAKTKIDQMAAEEVKRGRFPNS